VGLQAPHYNNAAWYLATSPQAAPRHVETAVEWARKAIELEAATDAPAALYEPDRNQPSNRMRFLAALDPYLARGSLYAVLQMYDRARIDFERALSSEEQPFRAHYLYALICLAAEEPVPYAGACRGMLEKFGATDDSVTAASAAWTCALAPGALDDYAPALDLARRAAEQLPADRSALQALGALQFRAGQLDEARDNLTAAVNATETERTSPAYARYLLAMTHERLGNSAEAHETLAAANELADRELNDDTVRPAWNRRVTLELLRKEAEVTVGGGQELPDELESTSSLPPTSEE